MDNLNSHHPDMETNLNSHHPDMDNLNSRGVTARAAQCREGEASTTVAHSR